MGYHINVIGPSADAATQLRILAGRRRIQSSPVQPRATVSERGLCERPSLRWGIEGTQLEATRKGGLGRCVDLRVRVH